jgi:hypothetical protein
MGAPTRTGQHPNSLVEKSAPAVRKCVENVVVRSRGLGVGEISGVEDCAIPVG